MWRPESVGDVIAERTLQLHDKRGARKRVRVRFGRPIKSPDAMSNDPWWCPVEVKGANLDSFRPVAGLDSLQALVLALDLATQTLSAEAERAGYSIEWLGDSERIIFAREALSRHAFNSLLSMVTVFMDVARALDSSIPTRKRTARALRAIVEASGRSVGSKRSKPRRGPAG